MKKQSTKKQTAAPRPKPKKQATKKRTTARLTTVRVEEVAKSLTRASINMRFDLIGALSVLMEPSERLALFLMLASSFCTDCGRTGCHSVLEVQRAIAEAGPVQALSHATRSIREMRDRARGDHLHDYVVPDGGPCILCALGRLGLEGDALFTYSYLLGTQDGFHSTPVARCTTHDKLLTAHVSKFKEFYERNQKAVTAAQSEAVH